MRKQNMKGLAFIAVTGALVTSCDLLKDLDYKVTPNPLEMHGDSVRVRVDVTFPEKGIKKKAKAEITPMLGSTALKTVTVLGEKATGNGTTILYKPGGKVVYEDIVAYKSDMETADLMVTGKVYKGDKEKEGKFEDKKVADATIITPFLVNKDFRVIYEKDAFRRVTEETTFAQINYEKGKSNVRPAELKDKDIVDLQNWMAAVQANPKINIKSISVVGYASPEGEEDKNNTLSNDRAEAGKKATMELSKKAKNDKGQTEIYSTVGRGEDYVGFKRELEKSEMNADEKNLVIRVLEMHQDPATRETEMRNMGKTFTYLDKNIFPLLRRSEMIVTYDLTGYSDEELKAIAASTPDSLNLEELLFTATLIDDLNEKLRIYQVAAKNFPNDHRTHNNVGAVLYQQNKMNEAKSALEKSVSVKDNAIAKNNLGAIAGTSGDRAKAKQLLGQAKGAGQEVSYNWGILNIQDGKYADAVGNFGSEATYNKALAQLLNGSAADATKTLDASNDKETAQGYYLKAVASARENKVDAVVSNLKNAFAKDGSLKAKAAKDREFLKFAENAAFSGIVM
jgi:outer membrane protein OmpA-like peptidoglycan-associated protein/tetratricopeptide (TPR) repeat protein